MCNVCKEQYDKYGIDRIFPAESFEMEYHTSKVTGKIFYVFGDNSFSIDKYDLRFFKCRDNKKVYWVLTDRATSILDKWKERRKEFMKGS